MVYYTRNFDDGTTSLRTNEHASAKTKWPGNSWPFPIKPEKNPSPACQCVPPPTKGNFAPAEKSEKKMPRHSVHAYNRLILIWFFSFSQKDYSMKEFENVSKLEELFKTIVRGDLRHPVRQETALKEASDLLCAT